MCSCGSISRTHVKGDNFPATGRGRAISAMLNALLDFGNQDALSGYAGAGVGLARVSYRVDSGTLPGPGPFFYDDSYSGLAWQGILGARYAVSQNIDFGLKYRYFNVPAMRLQADNGVVVRDLRSHWRSH